MTPQHLADWANTTTDQVIYQPDTLGLFDGTSWLTQAEQAEFFEWCGSPLHTIRYEVISAFQAYDLMESGTRDQIMFPEDSIDHHHLSLVYRYCPTRSDEIEIKAALDELTSTQALRVWVESNKVAA